MLCVLSTSPEPCGDFLWSPMCEFCYVYSTCLRTADRATLDTYVLVFFPSLCQAYKLSEEEMAVYPLLDALVSRIAAKEIITAGKGKG